MQLFVLDLGRITSKQFGQFLAKSLLIAPIFISGCSVFSRPEVNSKANSKPTPASKEDVFLYRGIGATYVCNARAAGIEFPKAVGVAAATYAQVINGRHGGYVALAGKEKLTKKRLFGGAEFQIITGAIQFCPKEVPDDVKAKVKSMVEKQKENPVN